MSDFVRIDFIHNSKLSPDAEDLLEQTAMQASQSMKIDVSDHAVALEKAIAKKRFFSIGMIPKYFSRFSINHVLKKNYKIHDVTSQDSVQENITATSKDISTPTTVLPRENSSKQTADSAVDDLLSVSTPAAAQSNYSQRDERQVKSKETT